MRREIVELLCCSLVLLTTLSPRPCVRLCARDNSLVELRPAHILRRSPYSPPDRPNASARSPFLHRLADCSCLTHRPEPVVRARTAIRDLRKPSLARPTNGVASLRHITRTLPSENRCFRSGTRPHPSRLSRLSRRHIANLRGWYAYTKALLPRSTSSESVLQAQGAQVCRVLGTEAYTALSDSAGLGKGASRSHGGEISLQSGLEASVTARRALETRPAAFRLA